MVLGNLIGGFVVIVVGVNLMPVVADQVVAATGGNVTGAAGTLLTLVTLFFALSIMATAISLGVSTLRQSGLV